MRLTVARDSREIRPPAPTMARTRVRPSSSRHIIDLNLTYMSPRARLAPFFETLGDASTGGEMFHRHARATLAACAVLLLTAPVARADVEFLGSTFVDGHGTDFSNLTST